MSARPDPQQFGDIGKRPASPGGVKRLWPLFKATMKAGAVGLAVLAWENAAPEPYKPSNLIGAMAARVASAEILGTIPAHIALQHQMNDLNYDLQIRLVKEQTYIQEQMRNEDGLREITKIADAGCIGSMIVGAIGQAYNSYDVTDNARKFAQGFCGAAQQAHLILTTAQQTIVRGDVTLETAGFDNHHYGPAAMKTLTSYFRTLSPEVQHELVEGASSDDVIADRVLIHFRQDT